MAVDQVDSLRKWAVISEQVANPAAGAEWSVTVPTGSVWRVRSIYSQLVTSATVANRLTSVVMKDAAGNIFFQSFLTGAQTAGGTWTIVFSVNAPNTTLGSFNNSELFIPDVVLPEGAVVISKSSGLQAGDQYSAISLLIEQAPAL